MSDDDFKVLMPFGTKYFEQKKQQLGQLLDTAPQLTRIGDQDFEVISKKSYPNSEIYICRDPNSERKGMSSIAGTPPLFVLKKIGQVDTATDVRAHYKDFVSEAILMIGENLTNVLWVEDIIEVEDKDSRDTYLRLPFCLGGSLRDRLDFAPVFESEAMHLLLCAIFSLDSMHRNCVVHVDLKPENILLHYSDIYDKWDVIIADLGISRKNQSHEHLLKYQGTPAFSAPEQLECTALTTASDIWSWGVIAHELLFGVHPYRELLENPQFTQPHELGQLLRENFVLPSIEQTSELALMIARCLSINPSERPSTTDIIQIFSRSTCLLTHAVKDEWYGQTPQQSNLIVFDKGHLGLLLAREHNWPSHQVSMSTMSMNLGWAGKLAKAEKLIPLHTVSSYVQALNSLESIDIFQINKPSDSKPKSDFNLLPDDEIPEPIKISILSKRFAVLIELVQLRAHPAHVNKLKITLEHWLKHQESHTESLIYLVAKAGTLIGEYNYPVMVSADLEKHTQDSEESLINYLKTYHNFCVCVGEFEKAKRMAIKLANYYADAGSRQEWVSWVLQSSMDMIETAEYKAAIESLMMIERHRGGDGIVSVLILLCQANNDYPFTEMEWDISGRSLVFSVGIDDQLRQSTLLLQCAYEYGEIDYFSSRAAALFAEPQMALGCNVSLKQKLLSIQQEIANKNQKKTITSA